MGIYDEDLSWVYKAGKQVPSPPAGWLNAFNVSKALKYLKMDDTAFMTQVSIWRAINIDVINKDTGEFHFGTTHFPLPPIIRFDPYIVSFWDSFKGGGDTATDLLDRFQERVGLRSENNMATARLLMMLRSHSIAVINGVMPTSLTFP